MADLWECRICKSVITRDQINGECQKCVRKTCVNCKRTCDRCQKIFCMFDIEVKLVMRQQQPHIHKLCGNCREVW